VVNIARRQVKKTLDLSQRLGANGKVKFDDDPEKIVDTVEDPSGRPEDAWKLKLSDSCESRGLLLLRAQFRKRAEDRACVSLQRKHPVAPTTTDFSMAALSVRPFFAKDRYP
jgi:hypothetical protein